MSIGIFSIDQAIKTGWKVTKENLGFLAGVFIFTGLVYILLFVLKIMVVGVNLQDPLSCMSQMKNPNVNSSSFSFLLSLVEWVVGTIFGLGWVKIFLAFIDNQETEFKDIFACYPLVFSAVIADILYGLMVFFGILLLIVPGVIWGIKYGFYRYFIVNEGLGPVEALKKSAEITNGYKMDLFVFNLAMVGINILGLLAIGIGLLVTIPMSFAAKAYVYRALSREYESLMNPPTMAPEQPVS